MQRLRQRSTTRGARSELRLCAFRNNRLAASVIDPSHLCMELRSEPTSFAVTGRASLPQDARI
jgi:hypothetical protein